MKREMLTTVIALLVMAFMFTGCVEHRYYHRNHQHTPTYYHRHNMTPPRGIDINIHN